MISGFCLGKGVTEDESLGSGQQHLGLVKVPLHHGSGAKRLTRSAHRIITKYINIECEDPSNAFPLKQNATLKT